MTYKTYTPNSLREFVRNFNFPNPDWSRLPKGFPNLPKKGLTREEGHLLDGIKLAWLTSEGRRVLYKTATRRTLVGITVIIFVVLLGRSLTASTDKKVTRTVSAKTVTQTFGEIIESTMSAVFR